MPVYKDTVRGTWYTKFRYKTWDKQTKWITKRGFKTKREAQKWENDFLAQKEGSMDMSFEKFCNVYLNDRGPRLKESTAFTKENIVRTKLIPYFGKLSVREITASHILKWQNEMLSYRFPDTGKPYSRVYLKTLHNQLSAIFNHAVRFYGLAENPARKAGNMGAETDCKMQFWTLEEYRRFSEAMLDDPIAYHCFQMLYWCGIREGELLALTASDFDLDAHTVSITKTFQHINGRDITTPPKTPKSSRLIKMPDFLTDEIRTYMNMNYDLHPEDRLFPVNKSYLYRKLEKGCAETGLRRIRVHDLRHSHVSLLINLGYSAVAIADRMGHESIDITYRYAHLFPNIQADMAEKLNELGEDDSNV